MNESNQCECFDWAHDGKPPFTMTHHPACPKGNPTAELLKALNDLIDGVQVWGMEGDGIIEECWDAYVRAMWIARGEMVEEREVADREG